MPGGPPGASGRCGAIPSLAVKPEPARWRGWSSRVLPLIRARPFGQRTQTPRGYGTPQLSKPQERRRFASPTLIHALNLLHLQVSQFHAGMASSSPAYRAALPYPLSGEVSWQPSLAQERDSRRW